MPLRKFSVSRVARKKKLENNASYRTFSRIVELLYIFILHSSKDSVRQKNLIMNKSIFGTANDVRIVDNKLEIEYDKGENETDDQNTDRN